MPFCPTLKWDTSYLFEEETGGTGGAIVPSGMYKPSDHSLYREFILTDENGDVVLDPLIKAETTQLYATIVRRNGYEYKFRLIDRFNSRLEKITSPTGESTTISYRADFPAPIGFTEEELRLSPTRLMQVYRVDGPWGKVAEFTYHPTKKSGRWAVSNIDFDGDQIRYTYNDGYLSLVERKKSGAAAYLPASKYVYVPGANSARIEAEEYGGETTVFKDVLLELLLTIELPPKAQKTISMICHGWMTMNLVDLVMEITPAL